MTTDLPLFDGATFDPRVDADRLGRQLRTVRDVMLTGKWLTLDEIARLTGSQPASISGLFEYRVTR